MAETFCFDLNKNCFMVKSYGHTTVDAFKQTLQRVRALAEEKKVYKILVDTRDLEETSDYEEIFDFSRMIPQLFHIALLISGRTENKLMFLESVAKARGVNIKSFLDEDAALVWLRDISKVLV